MSNPRGSFQVEFLRSVSEAGGRIVGARFSLRRGELGPVEPAYSLTLEQSGVRTFHELAWTPELERYLLEARRKMDDPDDETERFAAILLNNLEVAAREYGRDFAHAVFVAVVLERPEYNLAELLHKAATPRPSRHSQQARACAEFLARSVDGLRGTAELELGYSPPDAHAVMTRALAKVLDETFHISDVDRLFRRG